MNFAETHDLLTLIAQYDNRDFDDATVVAWLPLVADLDVTDARRAVMKHFATEAAYLMPVHVRDGVKAIRNERAQAQPHEVRALPSRFEADEVRDDRVRRGVRSLAELWSMRDERAVSGSALERALERARRERKGKQATTPATKRPRSGGPGIAIDKVTRAPDWADPKAREAEAIRTLHAAGRHCGRHHCPNCQFADLAESVTAHQEGPAA